MKEPTLTPQAPQHPLVDIVEVARMLGVDVRHVRRLVAQKRIPFIKRGHLLRFDPDDIASWLAGHRSPAASF